ncbi:hypothetical protein HPB51_027101 [Rhipicephalus microplus]|uniref:Uncharacterized protein n=1 Tax=Rhipicephalus microplus TaxID=6941 RepID=A0A9J6D1D3_RHIMP|nr:hypothetical protein HPB51_027101 [Rhipicephalus microplus]
MSALRHGDASHIGPPMGPPRHASDHLTRGRRLAVTCATDSLHVGQRSAARVHAVEANPSSERCVSALRSDIHIFLVYPASAINLGRTWDQTSFRQTLVHIVPSPCAKKRTFQSSRRATLLLLPSFLAFWGVVGLFSPCDCRKTAWLRVRSGEFAQKATRIEPHSAEARTDADGRSLLLEQVGERPARGRAGNGGGAGLPAASRTCVQPAPACACCRVLYARTGALEGVREDDPGVERRDSQGVHRVCFKTYGK